MEDAGVVGGDEAEDSVVYFDWSPVLALVSKIQCDFMMETDLCIFPEHLAYSFGPFDAAVV